MMCRNFSHMRKYGFKKDLPACPSCEVFLVYIINTGLEIATHWLPKQPKIEHW